MTLGGHRVILTRKPAGPQRVDRGLVEAVLPGGAGGEDQPVGLAEQVDESAGPLLDLRASPPGFFSFDRTRSEDARRSAFRFSLAAIGSFDGGTEEFVLSRDSCPRRSASSSSSSSTRRTARSRSARTAPSSPWCRAAESSTTRRNRSLTDASRSFAATDAACPAQSSSIRASAAARRDSQDDADS